MLVKRGAEVSATSHKLALDQRNSLPNIPIVHLQGGESSLTSSSAAFTPPPIAAHEDCKPPARSDGVADDLHARINGMLNRSGAPAAQTNPAKLHQPIAGPSNNTLLAQIGLGKIAAGPAVHHDPLAQQERRAPIGRTMTQDRSSLMENLAASPMERSGAVM